MALTTHASEPRPKAEPPVIGAGRVDWTGRDVVIGILLFIGLFLLGQIVVIPVAIVYDTSSGAFTVDRHPAVTALAAVPGSDGAHVTMMGDAFGNVWQLDLGNSDGCFGVEPVQVGHDSGEGESIHRLHAEPVQACIQLQVHAGPRSLIGRRARQRHRHHRFQRIHDARTAVDEIAHEYRLAG